MIRTSPTGTQKLSNLHLYLDRDRGDLHMDVFFFLFYREEKAIKCLEVGITGAKAKR